MMTGIMAAHAATRCLAHPARSSPLLREYEKWVSEEFETRVRRLRAYYEDNGIHV